MQGSRITILEASERKKTIETVENMNMKHECNWYEQERTEFPNDIKQKWKVQMIKKMMFDILRTV